MKWEKPGNENIDDSYEFKDGIILFGMGEIGKRYLHLSGKSELIKAFVDNFKLTDSYEGVPCWSFEELREKRNREKIIISAGPKYQKEMVKQLISAGYIENNDYYIHNNELLGLIYRIGNEKKDVVYVPLVQISLTERCTLRCKKCAHGCNYVDRDKKDLDIGEVYESADYFFKYTDLCQEFVLIGGEPFLYKDLKLAIDYIGKNYLDKINIFSITTNGTIIPNAEVLNICKLYDVLIRISNYEMQLPYLKKKHDSFIEKLNEFGVRYVLAEKEAKWVDYGFETVDYGAEEKFLIQHFDECKTPCREIQGSKFYYCVMAHTVGENMNHKGKNPNDCLELEKLDATSYGKRIFLEYNLGYSEKGYLDMCQYCHGSNAQNYVIPAAEQM